MFRDQTEPTLFQTGTVPETVLVRSLMSLIASMHWSVMHAISVCTASARNWQKGRLNSRQIDFILLRVK